MTLYDLIVGYDGAWTALEDEATEHYWSMEELTSYFNKAEREACQRSLILRYRHTDDIYGTANDSLPAKKADDICALAIEAGIAEYARSPKIIEIIEARLASGELPIELKTRKQLATTEGIWTQVHAHAGIPMYLIAEIGTEVLLYPIPEADDILYMIVAVLPLFPMAVPEYGQDVSFVAVSNEIRRAAGAFLAHDYQVGATVNISGSAHNDGDYTVSGVTATALTVDEDVTDEAAGASVVISSKPEIPEQYHRDLLDYVCHLAYKKNGKKTLDLQRSMTHLELFTNVFGPRTTANIEQMRVATRLTGGKIAAKYRI